MSNEQMILKMLAGGFQQQWEYLCRIAPPKVGELRKEARKTRRSTRSPQEPVWEEKVHRKPKGVVDFNDIPSP
jgi:hypothetical protein